MPNIIEIPLADTPPFAKTAFLDVQSATFSVTASTDWVRLENCDLSVQATGSATSIVVVVERSPLDPVTRGGPPLSYGPVNPTLGDSLIGSPAAGMSPSYYTEPGFGWWRATVTTLSGGNSRVCLTGRGG